MKHIYISSIAILLLTPQLIFVQAADDYYNAYDYLHQGKNATDGLVRLVERQAIAGNTHAKNFLNARNANLFADEYGAAYTNIKKAAPVAAATGGAVTAIGTGLLAPVATAGAGAIAGTVVAGLAVGAPLGCMFNMNLYYYNQNSLQPACDALRACKILNRNNHSQCDPLVDALQRVRNAIRFRADAYNACLRWSGQSPITPNYNCNITTSTFVPANPKPNF